MIKIALTGGIASGKSLVGGILREKGFAVIDIDSIISMLYRKGNNRKKIKSLFGSLNRKRIAEMAFSDSVKRKKLESILHPQAMALLRKKMNRMLGLKKKMVFVEIPLLFEAGFEKEFDLVVAVHADQKTRVKRLARKGFSREKALKRMNAQMPEKERVKKADFVIDNTDSISETRKQIDSLICELEELNE